LYARSFWKLFAKQKIELAFSLISSVLINFTENLAVPKLAQAISQQLGGMFNKHSLSHTLIELARALDGALAGEHVIIKL
jgi:hypothetical protein